jgi:hypothetical protein
MKDGDDRKPTVEEALELLCAPAAVDAIEDIDFEESDDAAELSFIRSWFHKEKATQKETKNTMVQSI